MQPPGNCATMTRQINNACSFAVSQNNQPAYVPFWVVMIVLIFKRCTKNGRKKTSDSGIMSKVSVIFLICLLLLAWDPDNGSGQSQNCCGVQSYTPQKITLTGSMFVSQFYGRNVEKSQPLKINLSKLYFWYGSYILQDSWACFVFAHFL